MNALKSLMNVILMKYLFGLEEGGNADFLQHEIIVIFYSKVYFVFNIYFH